MITNTALIHYLADKIYTLDKICRQNLNSKFIVSERDYVSNLLTFIKYPFGPFSSYSFAHSQTMPANLEQKFGVDGILIFKNGNEYKIGVFEAKMIKYGWDTMATPTISRFQRQLNNQLAINPNIAVWEMFLNKNIVNNSLDPFGSTCVKPDTARTISIKKNKWSYKDLFTLFHTSSRINGNIPLNLYEIISSMLECSFGNLLIYSPNGISLYENNDIKIPLIRETATQEDIESINSFLAQSEFCSYIHIDLNEELAIRRSITIKEILNNN
jgi:hypothetical protein